MKHIKHSDGTKPFFHRQDSDVFVFVGDKTYVAASFFDCAHERMAKMAEGLSLKFSGTCAHIFCQICNDLLSGVLPGQLGRAESYADDIMDTLVGAREKWSGLAHMLNVAKQDVEKTNKED